MIEDLRMLEAKGYLRCQTHPLLPLYVWNYTEVVQFDKLWNEHPLLVDCRGLVTDEFGNVVSRPFPKFWNMSEHGAGELPMSGDFLITTKMDGSLIIVSLWEHEGETYKIFNTRGSFTSEQAIEAHILFNQLYPNAELLNGYTYLFEYTSPTNRIVVTYDKPDLTLLAVVKTEKTGVFTEELDIRDFANQFNIVDIHSSSGNILDNEHFTQLQALNIPNEEGFVIKFTETNFRFKIKYENYCNLHKIFSGVNSRWIWEVLRDKGDFEAIYSIVPDEFADWVKGIISELQLKYDDIYRRANILYNEVKDLPDRKSQALHIIANGKDISGVVFNMLDGKDYTTGIWNLFKPGFDKPFTKVEESAE